jgi:DNA-binding MarR family transcriptional regulator
MVILLPDQLGRELQRAHGLSFADYEILVRLSEAPGRRLRMSDLADLTLSSKSRLSHQVSRMERAGLVIRTPCEEDRRGFWAELTPTGWQRLVEAAPTHVNGVREHFVDQLTPQQLSELGHACQVVADELQKHREHSP